MNVIIDNKVLPLEIMSTPNAISTGMMGRENIDGGMLFLFPEIGERSFWMKDCLISLDIIFHIILFPLYLKPSTEINPSEPIRSEADP